MSLPRTMAALLLLAGTLCAGDSLPGFELDAQLENVGDDALQGQLRLRGETSTLPNGTVLHVTLMVRGRSRFPLKAAIIKTEVVDGGFSADYTWPAGRTLAPMRYEVQVDLLMGKQPPPVRKALSTDYGWTQSHTEVVEVQSVSLGTAERQAEFSQQSLRDLLGFVKRLEGLQAEAATLAAAPADTGPWREQFGELYPRLVAFQTEFRDHRRKVVIRKEDGLIERLQTVMGRVIEGLKYCRRGRAEGVEMVVGLDADVRSVREEIESRLPISAQDEEEGQ